MDTIGIYQKEDTGTVTIMEQPQATTKENNPFAIFVMGVIGVFIFILLYIAAMKLVTVVNKTNRK
ncbi:MAG: hypothetical protein LBI60_02670 [Bacteroidales bacterium]|jgi:hypothetical protein|nr:hypothetical protein [Bacteroidales bacterium]